MNVQSPVGKSRATQNTMNGAEAFVRMLQAHDVEYVFGLCGDTSLPLEK